MFRLRAKGETRVGQVEDGWSTVLGKKTTWIKALRQEGDWLSKSERRLMWLEYGEQEGIGVGSGNQVEGHRNSMGERWLAWTPVVAKGMEGSLWV